MTKKASTDVAVDNVSTDSLSFAGLLCVEEQQSKSQIVHVSQQSNGNNAAQSRKEDHEFEFCSATAKLTQKALSNNSLADVLFSDGLLIPQAISLQVSGSQVQHADSKDSQRTPSSSNRRSRGNEVSAEESAKKTNTEARNKANNKQHKTASQGFGQKILQSIATPCRDCRAVQPTMKQQAFQQ